MVFSDYFRCQQSARWLIIDSQTIFLRQKPRRCVSIDVFCELVTARINLDIRAAAVIAGFRRHTYVENRLCVWKRSEMLHWRSLHTYLQRENGSDWTLFAWSGFDHNDFLNFRVNCNEFQWNFRKIDFVFVVVSLLAF